MALKDILVHADNSEAGKQRLRTALCLAREHDAHLIALYAVEFIMPYIPMDGAMAPCGWQSIQPLMEEMTQKALADAETTRLVFEELLARENVRGEWRSVDGSPAEVVRAQAGYADLCILGRGDASVPGSPEMLAIEHVMFNSGRPVLVLPPVSDTETVGHRIVVGWNGSRESVRAANDAMAMMGRAERTTILSLDHAHLPVDQRPTESDDFAIHIARHGIKVESARRHSAVGEEGAALLEYAAETGADLLVVGGYGHSRFREWVLGGVTRHVLHNARIPVLFSH